jgi:1-acyl-sn-glycerol-3-phosphate acyltransferase
MRSATSCLKIVWLACWAGLATLALFLPITLAALSSRTGNLAFQISRGWAWVMLKAAGVRTRVRGKEKIERGRGYVVIVNHQSLYDIPALVTALGIQFRWIIKKEVLKVPLFGHALHASRNIFIDRSNRESAIESIHRGMARLPRGTSLLFFAEGTRSPDGEIHDFKKGGFVTAIEGKLPILPVTVNGSRKVLPKKSVVFQPGTIEVVVGDPIDTAGYTDVRLQELMRSTRNTIISNYDPAY